MVTTEPNFKKNSPKETGESQHLFSYADVTKIQKACVVQALCARFQLRMRTVAENLRLSFEVCRIMNGVLTVISVISRHLSKEKIDRLSFLPIVGSFLRST